MLSKFSEGSALSTGHLRLLAIAIAGLGMTASPAAADGPGHFGKHRSNAHFSVSFGSGPYFSWSNNAYAPRGRVYHRGHHFGRSGFHHRGFNRGFHRGGFHRGERRGFTRNRFHRQFERGYQRGYFKGKARGFERRNRPGRAFNRGFREGFERGQCDARVESRRDRRERRERRRDWR